MNSQIINNYKINAFESKEEFLNYIENVKKILVAMNAEKILKEDKRLRKIVNSNIGYPDGIGAVKALRQKGLNAIKIPGSEFWLDIIKKYEKEKSFYLMGSTQEVIEKTVQKLKKEFPNINIVGYRNGFLKNNDEENLKKILLLLKPDIIFVAQGSPRQEYLMEKLYEIYPALYMGLGGSFDVYSGYKKRAPKIFIDLNLEWFYRLIKEPIRIKRQINLLIFLYFLLRKGLK